MSARCLCSIQSWGSNLGAKKTKKEQGRNLKFYVVETMCVSVWSFSRHTDVSFLGGGKTQNKKKLKMPPSAFSFRLAG